MWYKHFPSVIAIFKCHWAAFNNFLVFSHFLVLCMAVSAGNWFRGGWRSLAKSRGMMTFLFDRKPKHTTHSP